MHPISSIITLKPEKIGPVGCWDDAPCFLGIISDDAQYDSIASFARTI